MLQSPWYFQKKMKLDGGSAGSELEPLVSRSTSQCSLFGTTKRSNKTTNQSVFTDPGYTNLRTRVKVNYENITQNYSNSEDSIEDRTQESETKVVEIIGMFGPKSLDPADLKSPGPGDKQEMIRRSLISGTSPGTGDQQEIAGRFEIFWASPGPGDGAEISRICSIFRASPVHLQCPEMYTLSTVIALGLGKTLLLFSSTRIVLGKPAPTMKPKFRSWKRKLQRNEASYKRRDKRPEETRTAPHDYKLEWVVYQERKKEKERERLCDALYVPSNDTVRIERDNGSFRYIYKY
ncbi:hypothetical protein C8R47DRAFT_1084946 [Mycena vitilis]|nr:hypothetical protein C8R47DRAFT_1084946 [Mycena vitilis]